MECWDLVYDVSSYASCLTDERVALRRNKITPFYRRRRLRNVISIQFRMRSYSECLKGLNATRLRVRFTSVPPLDFSRHREGSTLMIRYSEKHRFSEFDGISDISIVSRTNVLIRFDSKALYDAVRASEIHWQSSPISPWRVCFLLWHPKSFLTG